MKRSNRSSGLPLSGNRQWFVYILECADRTLYTGATNDMSKRLSRHQTGKGARYTRGRLPVRLKYTECCGDKREALKREYAIKRLKRPEKLQLVTRPRADTSQYRELSAQKPKETKKRRVRHARHVG
jgi:putative endonuclease